MPLLGITALVIRGCTKSRLQGTRLQWLQYLNTLLIASSVLTSIALAIYLSRSIRDKNAEAGGSPAKPPATSQPGSPESPETVTPTREATTTNTQPQNPAPSPQPAPTNGAEPSPTPQPPSDSATLPSPFEEPTPPIAHAPEDPEPESIPPLPDEETNKNSDTPSLSEDQAPALEGE